MKRCSVKQPPFEIGSVAFRAFLVLPHLSRTRRLNPPNCRSSPTATSAATLRPSSSSWASELQASLVDPPLKASDEFCSLPRARRRRYARPEGLDSTEALCPDPLVVERAKARVRRRVGLVAALLSLAGRRREAAKLRVGLKQWLEGNSTKNDLMIFFR